MAFNGSGVYAAPSSSFNPAVADTDISETDWNTLLADLEAGLTKAICKDGQSVCSAAVPFASGISLSGGTTLANYVEGTWTPVLTFATAGDLSVVYSVQSGVYTRVGRLMTLHFRIVTSTFTHTTASGALHITGIPTATNSGQPVPIGTLVCSGIEHTGYTQLNLYIDPNSSEIHITGTAAAAGTANAAVTASVTPTGNTISINGCITYWI